MILHGIVTSFEEKLDYETKALTGYSATVLGSGGAAKVNFDLKQALPFAPAMSQVIWSVLPAEYEVKNEFGASKGMSTKFVEVVDEAHLLGLLSVIEENAKRFPVKA